MKKRYSIGIGLGLIFALTTHCQIDDQQPNIVLILIDDMGWKDVGYAGSYYYSTPNIDLLAADGMVFENAYSAAPVCTPSRGAIFSGKCPGRTALTTVFTGPAGPDDRLYDKSKYRGENDQFFEARNRHALPSEEKLLPEVLQSHGYITGFFGKWHIGECEGYYPDERGFDVAKGYRIEHGVKYGHWGKDWIKGNFANLPDPDSADFIAEILTEECIEFIQQNQDAPFFAVLSHYLVHDPVQPKPEKVLGYESKPASDQNSPKFAAFVESVDESVSQVIEVLHELQLEENTLIIFTSDNGGLTLPGRTSNYPLMGGKSFAFEGGTKVPLIIKWPDKIEPGNSIERVIGMDFYPTILSAAGIPLIPVQHRDGQDLLPILLKQEKLLERSLVFHFPHYTHATGPYSSIIDHDWKLIHFYNDNEGAYLLYNLLEDREEQNNLADKNIEKRDELIRKLDSCLIDMKAEMPFKNQDFDPIRSGRKYNLKYSLDLALKERKLFESRFESSYYSFRNQAEKIIETLQKWYNDSTGLWETTSWWNAANAITALIDYSRITGSNQYISVIENTFEKCKKFVVEMPNPEESWTCSNFINDYYDDEGWWILAWIAAYDLLDDQKYLDMAKITFSDMSNGWDDHCGGGIYWKKPNIAKSAVQNELFMLCAIRLHQRSPGNEKDISYFDWAMRTWEWFEKSGMINEDFLIENGLSKNCELNTGRHYTYNQGIILSALVEMNKETQELRYLDLANKIATAAIQNLVYENGILKDPTEPNVNGDASQFKGIFMRHLAYLNQVTENELYKNFILTNADAIWKKARNKVTNEVGAVWNAPFDKADASRQSSALDAFNAAITTR